MLLALLHVLFPQSSPYSHFEPSYKIIGSNSFIGCLLIIIIIKYMLLRCDLSVAVCKGKSLLHWLSIAALPRICAQAYRPPLFHALCPTIIFSNLSFAT